MRKIQFFIHLLLLGMIVAFSLNNLKGEKRSISPATKVNRVTITSYNAISNDGLDDTQAIQDAVDDISKKGGGTVLIPYGLFLIDATKSIELKDNLTLEIENGAILQAIPNNATGYEIVKIHDVKNVSVVGKGTIIGERNEHVGIEGEWGFGISIRGSEDVLIDNVSIQDCWGDGIYIGSSEQQDYSKNIRIEDPFLKNNRRQGISVISAIDLNIINPIITDTNGTVPESGIDIEPNSSKERLVNIKITNPYIENNKGYGMLIHLTNLNESSFPVSITVDYSENPIRDELRVDKPETVKGNVKILY